MKANGKREGNGGEFLRYIAGYLAGGALFLVLIPYGLVRLSQLDRIIAVEFPEFLAVRLLISLPAFLPGAVFMIWSNIFLFKIGKGGPAAGFDIAISPPTKRLVVSGPYRHSRNPMVFGAFSMYFAMGLFFFSVLSLAALTAFLGLARIYLKRSEEKRLLRDFGEEYAAYRNRVPMIFPRFRPKPARPS